jgi:predicted lipoprotein with Yx(FWY)xxD motif
VRSPIALGATVASIAALIAGCGSSGSNSTKSAAAPQSSSATQAAPAATAPTASESAGSGGVTIATRQAKLGTILAAGPKHMTVYLFAADKGTASSCSAACAQVWPPVTTSSEPKVGGAAVAADLGTVTRSDGTKQVTYKGHPLYFFARDGDQGDAYGQGIKSFGSDWYVLAPTGKKVDNS